MNTTFEAFKGFLLHILLILSFFFIFVYFIQAKWNQLMTGFLNVLISGGSIILCMTFPIITPSHVTDFRQIPFIMGSLYGGRRVAFVLFSILITYRLYLKYPDFQGSFLAYSLILVLLWIGIPFFHKADAIKKKLSVILIVSFTAVLIIICIFYFSFPELINTDYLVNAFVFFLVQFIVLSFFVSFIENSRKEKVLAKEIGKLERLKTVSALAASISHEVRNPLTVTRGFIQLLNEPGLTDEEKNRYIATALEALDKAESTITDYLTFAKPSLENVKILDLHKELTYIENFIKPYADMNNVEIQTNLEGALYIASEDKMLHQCLINIVKNGIEAMPQGGTLKIELKRLGDNAIITITDTGTGMNEEQLERLGNPFFTTKDIGTGLGTMVVYSTVKAMRGEIYVDSAPGKGTSFIISLPAADGSDTAI